MPAISDNYVLYEPFGVHNIATYLYNKQVYDWLMTIPQIDTVINKPSYFASSFAFFELTNGKDIISYGVGIYQQPCSVITLSSYFETSSESVKVGKVYFMKRLTIDIASNVYLIDTTCKQFYYVYEAIDYVQTFGRFVKFSLKGNMLSQHQPIIFNVKIQSIRPQIAVMFVIDIKVISCKKLELIQEEVKRGDQKQRINGLVYALTYEKEKIFLGYYNSEDQKSQGGPILPFNDKEVSGGSE